MNRTARALAPLLPALLLVALAATACGGSSDNNSDSGGSSASMPEPAAGDTAARDSVNGYDAEVADNGAVAAVPSAAAADDSAAKSEPADQPLTEVSFSRAVIRVGDVQLSSTDLPHAQIEVRKIVDRYAGEVTDEETQGDAGKQAYTRMVLRIPTADFDKAMAALRKVDKLESVSSNEKDVTAQVIDVQTRVEAQRHSIARITVLFNRAESIRDIMAIEAELSSRQADLEALERKRAQLASQTSMSTITVSIDATSTKHVTKTKHDDTGFLAGLSSGWDGLKRFAAVVALLVGTLLPWTIVVAVVGVPTYLLVRSLRRRTPTVVAEAPAEAQDTE